MARGNVVDGAGEPMYCELPDCDREGVRVDGSPVYRFVCLEHAAAMALEPREGFEPLSTPTRTLPLAVFDAIGPDGELRVLSVEQAIIALEDALASDEPLARIFALMRALREARTASPDELASIVAPGF